MLVISTDIPWCCPAKGTEHNSVPSESQLVDLKTMAIRNVPDLTVGTQATRFSFVLNCLGPVLTAIDSFNLQDVNHTIIHLQNFAY